MSREIKFRTWDGETMRYMPTFFAGVGQIGWSDEHYVDLGLMDNETIELMQYTGLKDKNKRDLYEGDIVKSTHPLQNSRDAYEVVYAAPAFMLAANGYRLPMESAAIALDSRYFEVIGTIYENPELLR